MKMTFMTRIFAIVTVCLLSLPLLIKISGRDLGEMTSLSTGENRRLNTTPPSLSKLKTSKIAKDTEAWLNDTLPFRKLFIKAYSWSWLYLIRSTHGTSILGKNGEIFPEWSNAPLVSNYLGINKLSPGLLENIKYAYTGMQAYCDHHGIKYLLVLIPDKAFIEKESLPFGIAGLNSLPYFTQMRGALEDANVNVLYMDKALMYEKKKYPVHNKKYDPVHWNGYGLQRAYEEICKSLEFSNDKENVPFEIENKEMDTTFGKEMVPFMILKDKSSLSVHNNDLIVRFDVENPKFSDAHSSNYVLNKGIGSGSMAILCDSYIKTTHQEKFNGANGAIFPLAYHVNKSFFTHHGKVTSINELNWIKDNIKPDYLIEVIVERMLPGSIDRFNNKELINLGKNYFYAGKAKDIVSGILLEKNLKTKDLTDLEKVGNVISLEATGKDPFIVLPEVYSSDEEELVFSCGISAPESTWAMLFYAREGTRFTKEHVVKVKVDKGENEVVFPIKVTPGEKYRIRLDPGMIPGKYEIRSLEAKKTNLKVGNS